MIFLLLISFKPLPYRLYKAVILLRCLSSNTEKAFIQTFKVRSVPNKNTMFVGKIILQCGSLTKTKVNQHKMSFRSPYLKTTCLFQCIA